MMTLQEFLTLAQQAAKNPDAPFPAINADLGELAPLAVFLKELIDENRSLRSQHHLATRYLRKKIDQLLVVIGTIPLRPEELDNASLITLDPIGIIAESFTQILDHLRQTNDKLELAMEENQAIFEAVGGGILVLDRNKQILSYNRKFEEMFARPEMRLTGQTCRDIICLGEQGKQCVFDSMLETGQAAISRECPRSKRHYNVIASPVKDSRGSIIRVVLLYLDITELVQAKEAVAEEKERLALTLKSIAEGVVATDTEGHITLMNQVAEKLTGWSLKEAFGQPAGQVFKLFAGSEQKPQPAIWREIAAGGGENERIGQATLHSRTGSQWLVTVSAAPILRKDQTSTGTIIVFRDITQEKKIEEEIIKSTRLDSLGLLAGGIAHDFNNMLTAIMGNVSVAKMLVRPGEKVHDLLAASEKSSARAKHLTQQLLTFAKGGVPLKRLLAMQKILVDAALFSLSGSNIKCEFSIPDAIWPAEADEGQLGQVIQNLVINACQAMPNGGALRIGAENIVLDGPPVLPLPNGPYIRMKVTDQGEGISKQNLEKIFDPYFTTKETGHGLGLTICYSIIKNHQGFITVDSEAGLGATFTIYLPASKKVLAKTIQKEEETGNSRGKILIMDDEEIIREVVTEMLSHCGYQVEQSSDGEEAVALYLQAKKAGTPHDIIIMDLTIPGGMGGKEAIGKLRQFDSKVKVIVSSGYANDPVMSNYGSYGFNGVVPKPFSIQELNRVLKKIHAGN
ncbi:MAG: PAS domain S-box protein [Deltaproteobacteria bacterium]|nr:PAS domain S-box protein [Deltaproteobacteria bacterium]